MYETFDFLEVSAVYLSAIAHTINIFIMFYIYLHTALIITSQQLIAMIKQQE